MNKSYSEHPPNTGDIFTDNDGNLFVFTGGGWANAYREITFQDYLNQIEDANTNGN